MHGKINCCALLLLNFDVLSYIKANNYVRRVILYNEKLNQLRLRKAAIMNHDKMAKSAVVLPLIENEGQLYILFEKRSMMLRHQPGEICFPGGGIELDDKGPMKAAIRETCEELGLQPTDINVICPLDIVVSPFTAIIYPYLAIIGSPEKIVLTDEVEKIILIPLDYLKQNPPLINNLHISLQASDDFPFHLIPQGPNYPFKHSKYPQIFYQYNDTVVWGLTALILTHFLELLNN